LSAFFEDIVAVLFQVVSEASMTIGLD